MMIGFKIALSLFALGGFTTLLSFAIVDFVHISCKADKFWHGMGAGGVIMLALSGFFAVVSMIWHLWTM